VVGGGDVGTRKVMTLLDCGAMVVVVSPAVTEKIEELSNKGPQILIKCFWSSAQQTTRN